MDDNQKLLCQLIKNNEHPNILLEDITYAWVNRLFECVDQLRSNGEMQGAEKDIIKEYFLVLSPAVDTDKLNVQNLKRKAKRLTSKGKGDERCILPMQGSLPDLGPYCKSVGISSELVLKLINGEKSTITLLCPNITCGLILELDLFFKKQNLTNNGKLSVLSNLFSASVEQSPNNGCKLLYALKRLYDTCKSLKNTPRFSDFLNSQFQLPTCFKLKDKVIDVSSSAVNGKKLSNSLRTSVPSMKYVECNELSEIPFEEIANTVENIDSFGDLSEKCPIGENVCCEIAKDKTAETFQSSIFSVIENALNDISVEDNFFMNEGKFCDVEFFSTINTISNTDNEVSDYKADKNLTEMGSYMSLENVSSFDINNDDTCDVGSEYPLKPNYGENCNSEACEIVSEQNYLGKYCHIAGLTLNLLLKAINGEKFVIRDKYLTKGLILELDSYFVKHKFSYEQRLQVLSNLLSAQIELSFQNVNQLVMSLKRLHRAKRKCKKSGIHFLRFLAFPFQLPKCLRQCERELSDLSRFIVPCTDLSLDDEILRNCLLRTMKQSIASKKILRATIQQKLMTEKLLRRQICYLRLQLKKLKKCNHLYKTSKKFYESKIREIENECLTISKDKKLKQRRLYYYKKRYGEAQRLLKYWIDGKIDRPNKSKK